MNGGEFKEILKNWTICTVLFCSILLTANFLVNKTLKRTQKPRSEIRTTESGVEDRQREHVSSITFSLCVLGVSTLLLSAFLVPCSLTIDMVLRHNVEHRLLRWLSRDLLETLWNTAWSLETFSVVFGLPFAFFYSEAVGIGTKQNLATKTVETLWTLSIVYTLFAILVVAGAGIFGVTYSFFLSTHPTTISFFSLCGCALSLYSIPRGMHLLVRAVGNMRHSMPSSQKREEKNIAELRLDSLQQELQQLKQDHLIRFIANRSWLQSFCEKENIHDVRSLSEVNPTSLYTFLQTLSTSSKIRPFSGSQAAILSILREAAEQGATFESSSLIQDARMEEQRLLTELSPQSGAKALLFNMGFFLAFAILVPILLVFMFRISFSVLAALPPVQEIASFWSTGVAPFFQSILPRLWFSETQIQPVEEPLWVVDLMDIFLSSYCLHHKFMLI
eukprot:TRINITY_DN7530_c0_g1_i2.p1 TRINITY_DN7530_c0_g1~~TRINITY_DN7530_c0_g1_i2.p1  ORF type:complete len:447 (+),score=84.12 TRINITY_DN7530_c0_g1_i2:117-1457(+)